MKLAVKCHRLEDHCATIASWADPYYSTEIGVAYAGYCFEAFSIIALLSRRLDQLVSIDGKETKPTGEGIVNLARAISDQYFSGHRQQQTQHVEILLFGFTDAGEPWLGELVHTCNDGPTKHRFVQPRIAGQLFMIGDGKSHSRTAALDGLRKRIAKHAGRIEQSPASEDRYANEFEVDRHKNAEEKAIEDAALVAAGDEFMASVGGTLQKLELYHCGTRAFGALCQDNRSNHGEDLPLVGSGLGFISTGERFGR